MKSLRDQILNAESEKEIDKLIEKGRTFKFAANGTIRNWARAAKKRIAILNGIH